MLQIHNMQITYRDIGCICGKLPIIYIYEVERSADYSNYFAKQMALKARTITATFPDGEQIKRRTDRTYTHVVKGEDKMGNRYTNWCGRPDLVAKRTARLTTYKVGQVTNDPWAN